MLITVQKTEYEVAVLHIVTSVNWIFILCFIVGLSKNCSIYLKNAGRKYRNAKTAPQGQLTP